ncbi:tRNA (uridine(54)-C5)-methyltransferase TrmA [Marinagarivorans algicola]|uniref:tRNA (uridine(54)-C5)-methyltransferase TrmA n=1 Tax=Marinagarivorans algicola TaxID=1513270 RepID=UPI0009EB7117|nr:tRNA (uridine(54)-C5)-methyltransferase TrmA [Marinagarivorans algicola]
MTANNTTQRAPALAQTTTQPVAFDYTSASYCAQLEHKKNTTITQFSDLGIPELAVFESPAEHYRMRAEFKIWHQGDRCDYAMFQPGTPKKTYTLEQFPAASATINELMPALLAQINANELLKRKLFQCEFLSTTTGECLITLIYHKPLTDEWQALAETIAAQLGCHIIGRARKQKRVLSRNWVLEELTINEQVYAYEHVEASFTQPNAKICADMLTWAQAYTQHNGGDLLELYCGNGNFTLPLAKNFDRVLATEISKSSVDSAKRNMARNTVGNIEFARLSSEEFTQALEGAREFRRLKHLALDSYHFSTVLVDPPRAGLDEGTLNLINRFEHIVYISCNPDTLHRDLLILRNTHSIEQFALFDQFPFTHHRECGVILKRK